MADQSHEILNIADLEAAASAKLSKMAREFYNSGATEQFTLHENTTVFNKYRLRPRVLTDVSGVDTSTTVFGRKISFPLCVAPTGLQKLAHPDGELASARACAKAGVPRWHPHQLSHSAATRIRKEFGLDASRVILGTVKQ